MKIERQREGISSVVFLRNLTKIMVFGCVQLGFLQNLTVYGKAEKASREEILGW